MDTGLGKKTIFGISLTEVRDAGFSCVGVGMRAGSGPPVPDLNPVVQRSISANLRLNFNPGLFFSIIFRAFN